LTWCECVYTHCVVCGEPLSQRAQDNRLHTCEPCAMTEFPYRPARSKEVP
jgi:hypothetical protein